jgi:hypothetical protein
MSKHRESLLDLAIESSSSDDDFLIGASEIMYTHYQSCNKPKHGGSVPGHKVVRRKREVGHWKLFEDYFSDDPTYGAEFFRRRFVISQFIIFSSSCTRLHSIDELFSYVQV